MKKYVAIILGIIVSIAFAMPAAAAPKEDRTVFTIVFKSESTPKGANKLITDLGGEIVYEVPEIGLVQVKAPASFGKKAIANASISAVNPSLIYEMPSVKSIASGASSLDVSSPDKEDVIPQSARYFDEYQWDIKRLTNNGATFATHSGNHDVVVGIIDSGIDLNHPDVLKNLLDGSKNFVPEGGVYGVDESEAGILSDVQDRNGHGTHVAGSIAGNGSMLGVAPNVGIKAYRVFGAEGGAYSAWIMAAIIQAANDHVDVINMSLGGIYSKGGVYLVDQETGERTRLGSDIAEYIAYKRAVTYAEKNGTLIVTAAGNDATDASSKKNVTELANELYGELGYEFQGASVYAPASLPNVVTVSATGPQDELAVYSNYGAGYVDVAAPGGNYDLELEYLARGKHDDYILDGLYAEEYAFSSVPVVEYTTNSDGLVTGYTYVRPGYSWYVGTSMAAPKVAAMAALIYDEYDGITPQKAKVMLRKHAEDIGKRGTDKQFGHGLPTVPSLFK